VVNFVDFGFPHSNKQCLKNEACVFSRAPSFLRGTKCPMSSSSSNHIEPHNFYHPFVLIYVVIDMFFTPFLMQTANHPLIPPPILTNHTPLSSSHYQLPTLHVNVGPQPYTFPNLFDHAQGPFPPFTLSTLTVTHDQTPNIPSSLQHTYNLHLKILAPHVGVKLLVDD